MSLPYYLIVVGSCGAWIIAQTWLLQFLVNWALDLLGRR